MRTDEHRSKPRNNNSTRRFRFNIRLRLSAGAVITTVFFVLFPLHHPQLDSPHPARAVPVSAPAPPSTGA